MKVSENLNNMNKYKFNMRILIGMIAILLIITTLYMVFADSNVVPAIREMDGVPYMYFELEHSLSNAQYKYYGYGYTVSVYEPGPNGALLATKYIQNAQFKPYMDGSTEKVWIPMQEIYGMVNLDDEFYSVRNLKVYLNGRLGIKVNGTLTHLYDSYDGVPENGLKETGLQTGYWKESLTVPLNKDGQGIKNGIEHEYGVSWSATTRENLRQHFGIPLTVPAVYKYDRYRVEYREISSKKTVSSGKPYQNFDDFATITEHPVLVNGYEYAGQYMIKKIDTDNNEVTTDPYGDTQEGDSATINIKKNADRYIITFYYTKVDPSSIGKPVTVNIEYREDTFDGKKLLNSTTTIGGDLSQFNFNSAKIDDYNCIGYYVIGQGSEYFHDSNVSFIIGKENYSKPVDGRLTIIFIYEEEEKVEILKCSPSVKGNTNIINIIMKKAVFENATEININNAVFKIDSFTYGKDSKGNSVDGIHGFRIFDLYVDKYISSFDNTSNNITQNFIVPKDIFIQSTIDTNLYTVSIDTTFSAFCKCSGESDSDGDNGWAMDKCSLNVNITLLENKPPMACFSYYSRRIIDGEDNGIVENKAYIGSEVVIKNRALDPNGLLDIKCLNYTLTDSNKKQYYAKLLLMQDKTYFLYMDNVIADNIKFSGITDDGDLKLEFTTKETWTISQYVEDLEGLNDTYTDTLTTEELDLKPTAVISDNINYRYPVTNLFNGKKNRVVMFDSSNSYAAIYYIGTGIEINHTRDNWEIVPLNGQDLTTVKFGKDIVTLIEDNVLKIKYQSIDDVKLMFKESGQYILRLQVTDAQGNVSDWTEKIITINEDKLPTVTANISSKYYRDSTGYAKINITSIILNSIDEDIATLENIRYRYDTNNNDSFNDENWTTLGNITYINTMNLGNYQFEITAKESFGQETLESYITDLDYKRNQIFLYTEIDNIAPNVTKFKIMTTEN